MCLSLVFVGSKYNAKHCVAMQMPEWDDEWGKRCIVFSDYVYVNHKGKRSKWSKWSMREWGISKTRRALKTLPRLQDNVNAICQCASGHMHISFLLTIWLHGIYTVQLRHSWAITEIHLEYQWRFSDTQNTQWHFSAGMSAFWLYLHHMSFSPPDTILPRSTPSQQRKQIPWKCSSWPKKKANEKGKENCNTKYRAFQLLRVRGIAIIFPNIALSEHLVNSEQKNLSMKNEMRRKGNNIAEEIYIIGMLNIDCWYRSYEQMHRFISNLW